MVFTYQAITANCGNYDFGPQATESLCKHIMESNCDFYILNLQEAQYSFIESTLKTLLEETYEVIKCASMDTITNINSMAKVAVGMSGDVNSLLEVEKFYLGEANDKIDIGLVGYVTKVDVTQIIDVIESGQIPVISTTGIGQDKKIYNVNADTAASAIACAIKAQKLVILTDVSGLMENYPDEKTLIPTIDITKLKELLPTLDEGMKPKMQACLEAVEAGVVRAHVIDGRSPHAVLVEVFTNSGTGTMVIERMDQE
jgi:acetylglutamate kinase